MCYKLCLSHKRLLRQVPHGAGGVYGARDEVVRVKPVPVKGCHWGELVQILGLRVSESGLFHEFPGGSGRSIKVGEAVVVVDVVGVGSVKVALILLQNLVYSQALRCRG